MSQDEGYYCYTGPELRSPGNRLEDGFLICGHCEIGMLKSAWTRAGGLCLVCERKLCTNCVSRARTFGCEVAERRIDQALTLQHRREQNAKEL